jgi:hypothetical protein
MCSINERSPRNNRAKLSAQAHGGALSDRRRRSCIESIGLSTGRLFARQPGVGRSEAFRLSRWHEVDRLHGKWRIARKPLPRRWSGDNQRWITAIGGYAHRINNPGQVSATQSQLHPHLALPGSLMTTIGSAWEPRPVVPKSVE